MASALFAVTAAVILTAGVHWMTRVDVRMTSNRESAFRALEIAEAGVSHTLGIMRDALPQLTYTEFIRGPDTTVLYTSDDGYLIGRTLTSGSTGNDIPVDGRAYGGGRYEVQVFDDPADADLDPKRDSNTRVLVRCTGYGPDGSKAQLDVLIAGITIPGFFFDGDVTIKSATTLLGKCGGIHANGNINVDGGVVVKVSGPVTAGGLANGTFKDATTNLPVVPQNNQPLVDLAPLNPAVLCPRAKYRLESDGDIWDQETNTHVGNANGATVLGWKLASSTSPFKWDVEATPPAASWCVDGNVTVSAQLGTDVSPLRFSLYANGSVSMSGNPYIVSYDADSVVIAANGDVSVSGNPTSGKVSYSGVIYAKYQCKISGNPVFSGQVICDNDSGQPASAVGLADFTEISGNPSLTYDCNNKYASTRRFVGWIQTPGTP